MDRDPVRALEYISIGLKLAPDDQILLSQQSICFIQLERFAEALSTTEKLVKLYPGVVGPIMNLAEFYLFNQRISDYETVAAANINSFRQRSEFLPRYFEAVKFFLTGDLSGLQKHIKHIEPSTDRQHRLFRDNELDNKNCLPSLWIQLVASIRDNGRSFLHMTVG